MTVAFPSQLDNRRCFQTLPHAPCRAKPLPCLPSWEPLLWSNHGCKQAGGLQAEAGPQGRVTVKKKTSNRTDVSSILGFALLCFCLKSHPWLVGGAGVQHYSGCTFSCSWPLPSWPLWDLFDTVPNQTSLKWILSKVHPRNAPLKKKKKESHIIAHFIRQIITRNLSGL